VFSHGGQLGLRTLRFSSNDQGSISQHFERLGHVPLPPYIERPDDEISDRGALSNCFCQASMEQLQLPRRVSTSRLKFLRKFAGRGAEICELTLNVGLGTFQPNP